MPRFSADYDRLRDLPRLLRLWPHEATALAATDHSRLLDMLRQALRAERRRGAARTWGYDIARHRALVRALRAETAAAARPLAASRPPQSILPAAACRHGLPDAAGSAITTASNDDP